MSPEERDDEQYAQERQAMTAALRRCLRPEHDVVDAMRYVGNIIRSSRSWSLSEDETVIVQFCDDWGYQALLRAMSDVFPAEAGRVPRGIALLAMEG